ncbi:4-hydroxy-tetrahydrodipicolinate reductase [uncultured Eudoraea sp.]|uniref:4-hydroxy-tetrahydrodipicolinate reductase n=1 Tax=uncultured Eudoraea sp. TaxID=1035614 RepID=UPI00261D8D81|nr:4-hydroxy-tetrahydrodipicolinate reductase [uncultured Eudoraea sp.]
MNIGLFGYGKMGKMIEKIAIQRNHSIVAKIDVGTKEIDYSAMDMAIDFSSPEAAFNNIKGCLEHNIPVISGTTGWLNDYENIISYCNKKNGAFIYASNFSLGVNLFFQLNSYLAKMMNNLPEYKVSIEEIHHLQKLDAPSGTAISLAEDIIDNSAYEGWLLEKSQDQNIPIISKRIADEYGTHIVSYENEVDEIVIKHKAHNREGFALGAIVAAEWLNGKKGVFSMKDVLNLG